MHNFGILVGFINGSVVTIIYAAAVVIAVAECGYVNSCSISHDALSKMSVVYRYGREMVEMYVALMEEFIKNSCGQSGRRAGLSSFLLRLLPPNHFYAKKIRTHWKF